MLMIACSGMAMVLGEGSHDGPRPKAEGHYCCPKVNINSFINWLLSVILTPGLTKPLWDLLGHYEFY